MTLRWVRLGSLVTVVSFGACGRTTEDSPALEESGGVGSQAACAGPSCPTGGLAGMTESFGGSTTGSGASANAGSGDSAGGRGDGSGATGDAGIGDTGGSGMGNGDPGSGGTANPGGMGSSAGVGGVGATAGSGGDVSSEGPCDLYEDAGTPCAAAYSTVRRLSSAYAGPLYQVRSGSSAENTGSGGQLHDIGVTAAGFADAAAQDAICKNTICTVSLLYDQSGNGKHLPVAPKGGSVAGEFADEDDFESIADAGPVTVGAHRVYSLYMEPRQGYRLPRTSVGKPPNDQPQSVYLLADGTRNAKLCCWTFGNAAPSPTTFAIATALALGPRDWGKGAGEGPWFVADFEGGFWAGGSNHGDPGWGDSGSSGPANPNNPSLPVPFALGFLKMTETEWSLRMANAATATSIVTAYTGMAPKRLYNAGGIVLGIDDDNANNSWGTFYEGAIVVGYPDDATDLAVMRNIQSAGYGK